ncbi:MAG TPA: sulfate/molybdate ABC transporter ATP-binding protein [Beijerinckiaceae bacterium]|jgi:sulfate transport system ATP-binding protein
MEIGLVGVEKSFAGAAALRGVSLDVRPGELLALLGPSGSGKTTLLRIIAGLEVPNRGRVLFSGEDATNIPVQRRQVGFVFQHYALFRHLNVADNIAYGLRARPRATRPAEREIARRVGDLLALVQLDGYERRFPAQLSGGQRQRVALARALAVEPRVLLLDEPFGALDARVRKDLRRWLREIHERTGQTTVFVTHDQDEALELADRVAVLNDGMIEQVGTPDEVYDAPSSRFVASFLGMNVTLRGIAGGGRVTLADRQLQVPVPPDLSGSVDLLFRPWDFRVEAPGHADGWPGLVRGVRRAGALRRLEIALADELTIEADAPIDQAFAKGDRVCVTLRGAPVVWPA